MVRRHILHISPSFAPGGAQVRAAQIMSFLGSGFRHTVVSLDGELAAAARVDSGIDIRCLRLHRSGNPIVMVNRVANLLRTEKPHLLLTYNWGSIDAIAAAGILGLGPLIHEEDGFGADEALRQKRRRVLFRRLVLRGAYRVVAPSRTLMEIMQGVWKLPVEKLEHIPNGIDLDRFVPGREDPAPGEVVVGTVGHLRPEKRQGLLLEACAALSLVQPLRLLIAGDGPERKALGQTARSLCFADRVTFLGHHGNPAAVYRRMDLFALSSLTEQMPLAVLEAMASGLPIVSTDVGDIKGMVSPENRPFIASTCESLQAALAQLARDPGLRKTIGAANRARCVQLYDIRSMLARYGALYEAALRRHPVSRN